MAYFAELDDKDIVLRVISISDANCQDENGNEVEQIGIEFCKKLFGENTRWLQTSYNTVQGVHINGKTPLRWNFASAGFTYDSQRDAFYASLNVPEEEKQFYVFDEQNLVWIDTRPKEEIGVTRV